ncbi:MAG TPA: hypothetical protein VMQ73_18260 [Methylomirabilota bacterium]|nr:hypothetical protein [Methylomirabilota bacterium]
MESLVSIHRYSAKNLLPDYLRGAAGLAIGGGGWLLAPSAPHVIVIFGGLTVLFLLFTMRTVARQRAWIELTEESISIGRGRETLLRWSDLDRVKLRYYSTRRNRSGGWMTLKLSAGATSMSVDSNIDGFDAIAARAARALRDNRLLTDDTTVANLAALGLMRADEADAARFSGAS